MHSPMAAAHRQGDCDSGVYVSA